MVISRVYSAVSAGWGAFRQTWSGYQPEAMIPQEKFSWDAWQNRLARYEIYSDYYNNIIYTALTRYAALHRESAGLYQFIRPIHNPVSRLVDWYAAKLYPGEIDYDDAQTGAIPISAENPRVIVALLKLWRDSHWDAQKSVYGRNGAMLGDSFIKVVDDMTRQEVRLEVLDPRKVIDVQFDAVGNVTSAVIEYILQDPIKKDSTGRPENFVYTEKWTSEKVETFRDGNLYAYNLNALGEPVAFWDNEYGRVPIFHAPHRNMGLKFGANAFNSSISKIDYHNDIASVLLDAARKQVNFPIVGEGIYGLGTEIQISKKDQMLFLGIPENTHLVPLTPNINLADGLAQADSIYAEIKRDLPELELAQITDVAETATAVRQRSAAAISRIQEVRPNYDNALIAAQQLALEIGGDRRYPAYRGFGFGSAKSGEIDHMIKPRDIIQDDIALGEKMNLIIQAAQSPAAEVIYRRLGLTADEVRMALDAQTAQQASFLSMGDMGRMPSLPMPQEPEQAARLVASSEISGVDVLDARRLLSEIGM